MIHRSQTLIAAAAVFGCASLAFAAGGGSVDITSGPVHVDTSIAGEVTVSVDITNAGTAKIKVDLNVIALGNCQGDVLTCSAYDCTREAVGGVEGVTVEAGITKTLAVTLPLAAGDYLFRARTTGVKGGNEDQTFGVQTATVL